MKIERVIQLAGMVERGNVLPEELAIEFLSEFDGMIQSDIMLHAPEEIVRYDNVQQELLLRPPHDGLYLSFLVAMIRQCQGEYEGYNNAQEIVEDKLKTFRRWYIHHYRPADTGSRDYTGGTSGDGFGFAYLSAYGLAAKHGYQGTEEEWLQSLKGEKGDAGAAARMRYDAERDMVQWGVGDEWHDLYTMAEVLAPLYEKLDEMTARAETAAGEAAGHAQAAQTAREQVENVLHDAEGHAREALYQANNAKAAAQVAKQAGADAEAAIEAAQEARQSAAASEASANLAKLAAQRSDADAQAALRAAEEAGNSAADATAQAGAAADSAFQAEGSAQAANQAYVEAERMTTRAETARAAAQTAAEEARAAAEETKNAAGTGNSGPAYVASEEPPEDTRALWVDTAEPEEAVALGATAVETAEGVDIYCTDELGTTKVTVRNGKDGAQGPAGPQGAPGENYVLTDEDMQEIAGIAAGMVPGGGGGDWTLLFDGTIEVTEPVRSITASLLASCEGMTEIFATGSWTANANTESGNDNAQLVIGRYSTNQGGLGDMSNNQNFAVRFSRAGDYEFVEILKNPNYLAANNSSITGVVDTLHKPENSNYDNLSIHPFAMTYQGTITLTVTGR